MSKDKNKKSISDLAEKAENAFEQKFGIELSRVGVRTNDKNEVTETYNDTKCEPSAIAEELQSKYHELNLMWRITFNLDDVRSENDESPIYCWMRLTATDTILLDDKVNVSTTYYANKDDWDELRVSLD